MLTGVTGGAGSRRFGSTLVCASNPSDGMSKFKITVARIEVDARDKQNAQVRITFQVERAPCATIAIINRSKREIFITVLSIFHFAARDGVCSKRA
jgi:hypothetical protein